MAIGGGLREADRCLATGLVHKLRNYLNAMRAQVALLRRFSGPDLDPRASRQLAHLDEVVSGIEGLANEYLALANPEKNDWQESDLAALARESVSAAVPAPNESGIAVVEEFTPDLPPVLVDREKIRRALACLVTNACQAMTDGGTLTVRVGISGPDRIVVEIGDTGCGIAPEEQARIYEPFFSTKPDCLGLGLALAQRIARDHGGRLAFRSRLGAGSIFRVTLPTALRQQAVLAQEPRPAGHLQPVI